MTPPSLEGTDVARSFGGLRVLHRVSFSVPEGEIVALIGPNGAGKTTPFNLVSGLLRPSAGSIRATGRSARCRPIASPGSGSGARSRPRGRSST
jgi:ABC-type branched-subunit amino acid transport system ATPase component